MEPTSPASFTTTPSMRTTRSDNTLHALFHVIRAALIPQQLSCDWGNLQFSKTQYKFASLQFLKFLQFCNFCQFLHFSDMSAVWQLAGISAIFYNFCISAIFADFCNFCNFCISAISAMCAIPAFLQRCNFCISAHLQFLRLLTLQPAFLQFSLISAFN